MAAHKFIICYAEECVVFHSIICIEMITGEVNFASSPHVDTHAHISMDDPNDIAVLVYFEQYILPVGHQQKAKVPETCNPMPDDREHDIFQDERFW